MQFFQKFSDLRLDIVGIVAILGEGSTQRNAQASALSWHHILPRIYPAPQALLKHHQDKLLPIDPGVVVGAQSGRIRNELNFFIRLLHPEDVPKSSVQMLEVKRNDPYLDQKTGKVEQRPAIAVKKFGHLAALSILGFCLTIILLSLAIWQKDGNALIADICLSGCSSLVGFASWSKLDVKEEVPARGEKELPLSDVVIFYPARGSFRVIRCTEKTSRLYFRVEHCSHYLNDDNYRRVALFSSVLLMAGLIMLGNAQPILQAAFAASYILLNALYWASSALNPSTHVWRHDFTVREIGFMQRVIKIAGDVTPQLSEISPGFSGPMHASPPAKFENDPVPYVNGNWKEDMINGRTSTFLEVEEGVHQAEQLIVKNEVNLIRNWDINDVGIKMLRKKVKTNILENGVALPHAPAANPKPRVMTSALWTAIALTGNARWARSTNIAPNTVAWDRWLGKAERMATSRWSNTAKCYLPACKQWKDAIDRKGHSGIWIQIPEWEYFETWSAYYNQSIEVQRAGWAHMGPSDEVKHDARAPLKRLSFNLRVQIAIRIWLRRVKKRQGITITAAVNTTATTAVSSRRIAIP